MINSQQNLMCFVTQGGTLYDGKIYYTYGFGGLEYPNAIRVFDLAEKKIVAKIDLSDSIFSNEEIESCGVYEELCFVIPTVENISARLYRKPLERRTGHRTALHRMLYMWRRLQTA